MSFKEKVNGYSLWIHRIIPTLLTGLILFILSTMLGSIKEIRKDFKELTHNMVYKCDYVEDLNRIRKEFDTQDIRIREVEIVAHVHSVQEWKKN